MRLVTCNIRGGLGTDGARSLARIADVLRDSRAEIICLQEVHHLLPQSGFQNQAMRLAKALGFQSIFQNNLRLGFSAFGNAILTPFPLRAVLRHRLPNDHERKRPGMRFEHRGLLGAALETPVGSLAVWTTHWSLEAEDRAGAVAVLAEAAGITDVPTLLAGDFNALADSSEMQAIAANLGFADAGARSNLPTYPSSNPRARIDYLWHSPHIRILDLQTIPSLASDHLPVVADFEW